MAKKSDLVAVKFTMNHTIGTLFAKGEVAGFPASTAEDLIKRGLAEPLKAETAAQKKKRVTAEVEALSDDDLAAAIQAQSVEVADDADRAAKNAALIEARLK